MKNLLLEMYLKTPKTQYKKKTTQFKIGQKILTENLQK